jgi:hypothetical protein
LQEANALAYFVSPSPTVKFFYEAENLERRRRCGRRNRAAESASSRRVRASMKDLKGQFTRPILDGDFDGKCDRRGSLEANVIKPFTSVI